MRRRILWIVATALVVIMIATYFVLDIGSWQSLDLEKLDTMYTTTILYDDQGEEFAELYNVVNRIPVSIDQIPEHVVNAFIAAEDKRFYSHFGVDLWRIGGAVVNDLKSMEYSQGASTITQQLIKLTHLTGEKTMARKAQEAYLAIQLEWKLDKPQILEKYLNIVYFGKGAYGVEAAARVYFNKSADALTLAEGALLAGVIKSAPKYAPHLNPENAISRRNLVLDEMVDAGFINSELAEAAKAEPLSLSMAEEGVPEYGWYVDNALSEAEQIMGITADEVLQGGYRIYTALDRNMQTAADELFEDSSRFPASAADGTPAQAALTAIDVGSGEIVCLVGGREYETRRGMNRATQMKRQPGSTFKPISVYAAAIDQLHLTPTSFIEDVQRDFGNGYSPANSSGTFYGTVTLRQALARSMNVAAVDLITKTGVSSARRYATLAGVALDAQDDNLSLALGSLTYGVSPVELCAAYAPLSNGGNSVSGHAIRRIEDREGRIIYQYQASEARVMARQSAYMITSMLESAAQWGTAKELASMGFPVAGKTGTVGLSGGGNKDAWVVAYTPTIATVVWMGFDLPDQDHSLSNDVGGGSYPARLAAAFMTAVQARASAGEFLVPEGITSVLLDNRALTILHQVALASEQTPKTQVVQELFYAGQTPTQVSNLWETPIQVTDLTVASNASGLPVIQFTALQEGISYLVHRIDGNQPVQIGALTGVPGQIMSLTDTTADAESPQYYRVVPRHIGFFEEGIAMEGPPSTIQKFEPEKRRLIDWFWGAEATPAPDEPSPLFG